MRRTEEDNSRSLAGGNRRDASLRVARRCARTTCGCSRSDRSSVTSLRTDCAKPQNTAARTEGRCMNLLTEYKGGTDLVPEREHWGLARTRSTNMFPYGNIPLTSTAKRLKCSRTVTLSYG